MKFDQINEVLTPYPELESPSFLQGMLIGLMCGDNSIKESVWLKKILEEAGVKSVKESFLLVLHELFLETDRALNGSGFELDICLPDDGEDLRFRGGMLGQFCEGFSYGMGLVGQSEQKLKGDVLELFNDFGNIACIDVSDLEDSNEDDESSLMQLIEYVKIGVMTINEELNPVEGSPINVVEPPTDMMQ